MAMKLARSMSRLGTETAFEVLVRARALEAQGKVGIKLNARKADVGRIIELLPSLTAPTMSNLFPAERLHGEEWFSVESVIAEATVRELIPRLIKAGALGIIEYPLNKVI